MAWIRGATPDDDPTGEVAAAFDRDRATLGHVANYTRVFAHRPAVLRGWQGLNGAIKGMDPRRYEVATTAAALRLRSSYCALAHGDVLASRHMSPDAVRALAHGEDSDERPRSTTPSPGWPTRSPPVPRTCDRGTWTSCARSGSPTTRSSTWCSPPRHGASSAPCSRRWADRTRRTARSTHRCGTR